VYLDADLAAETWASARHCLHGREDSITLVEAEALSADAFDRSACR